jgi:tetratricopeptide (TPR) repeat protein
MCQLSTLVEDIIKIISDRFGATNSDMEESVTTIYALEKYVEDNFGFAEDCTRQKLNYAIQRFCSLGKISFSEKELIELFNSIQENEILNRQIKTPIPRVISCDFETLSTLNPPKGIFCKKYIGEFECELLDGEVFKHDYILTTELLQNPVMKVTIQCQFQESTHTLKWIHSSTSTHIDNMLAAVKVGLGCPLKVLGLSTQALSDNSQALARATVSLSHGEDSTTSKTYLGLWVDVNNLLGIIQSMILAVNSWLYCEYFQNISDYHKTCVEINTIQIRFDQLSEKLSGYGFKYTGSELLEKEDDYLRELDGVIKSIQTLQADLCGEFENPAQERRVINIEGLPDEIIHEYQKQLKKHEINAHLIKIRYFFLKGLHKKASKELDDLLQRKEFKLENFSIESNLDTRCPTEYDILSVILTSELINSQLFSCSRIEHLEQLGWLKPTVERCLEVIRRYIRYQNHGSIDYDSYFAASEICGRAARFILYCSNNVKEFQDAILLFEQASFYAYRIGNTSRSSAWLVHACRSCIRLNDTEQAEQLLQRAQILLDTGISNDKKYREVLYLQIRLAQGELAFAKNDFKQATQCFLTSLVASSKVGFLRISADSLYNLSRTIKTGDLSLEKLQELFKKITENPELQVAHYPKSKTARLIKDLENFIRIPNLHFPVNTHKGLANKIREMSQKIWSQWFCSSEGLTRHVIESKILDGTFLSIQKPDN